MDERASDNLPDLLDAKQVAAYLGLHEVTVLRFARRRRLPAFKVGREWRFRADDLRAWVQARSPRSDGFAKRFDALWARLRSRAEAAGYRADDIPRLIREVRSTHSRARRSSRGS